MPFKSSISGLTAQYNAYFNEKKNRKLDPGYLSKQEYLAINECEEYDEIEEHLRQFVVEKPKPGSHPSF
jgi:hypothetical protein